MTMIKDFEYPIIANRFQLTKFDNWKPEKVDALQAQLIAASYTEEHDRCNVQHIAFRLTLEDDINMNSVQLINDISKMRPYTIEITQSDGSGNPVRKLNFINCRLRKIDYNLSYSASEVAKFVLTFESEDVVMSRVDPNTKQIY